MDDYGSPSSRISSSLELLKIIQEETCLYKTNVAVLNNHIWCLTNGLELLDKILSLSTNEYLSRRIEHLADELYHRLFSFNFEVDDETHSNNLDEAFTEMRAVMMNVLVEQPTDEYVDIFLGGSFWIGNLRGATDFLLESTVKLISNDNGDQSAPLIKELKDLKKFLTYLKPLINYVNVFMKLYLKEEDREPLAPLFAVFDKAICLFYSSLVGTHDDQTIVSLKNKFSKFYDEIDISMIYLVAIRTTGSAFSMLPQSGNEFCLLGNLIKVLQSISKSLNNATSKLLDELLDLRCFLTGLEENVRLKKLHYFQQSVERTMLRAIPILCSCYEEENEEHATRELSSILSDVLNLIKNIKSSVKEIKLYDHPRTDTSGYLQYFLGYVEELLECYEMSTCKSVMEELKLAIKELPYSIKLNPEKYRTIVNLAYQAEYLIDCFLATPCNNITDFNSEELRKKLNGILEYITVRTSTYPNVTLKLKAKAHAPWDQSPTAKDSAMTSDLISSMGRTCSNVLVGYKESFDTLMDRILCGQSSLDVLSIVGMTGVGKTTLAQSLYTDPSTLVHFDVKAWCTVSESYQTREIMLKILCQIYGLDDHLHELDYLELCDKLCRALRMKRFFIVIDDLWDIDIWNSLKRIIPEDRQHSRVLVTTRSRSISSKIRGMTQELNGLSKAHSLELLKKKLSPQERISENMLDILKKISDSCQGLPLSIITIAGVLLNREMTEDVWKDVAKDVRSHILADTQVKNNLQRSYNKLPGYLQQCFLYLGAFPEDREYVVTQLIQLWIAEGMVRKTESRSSEDIGKECISDLISYNLIIPVRRSSDGEVKTFRLHDLQKALLLEKAMEDHIFMVLNKTVHSLVPEDPRRLSINCYVGDYTKISCHSVRSLICHNKVLAYEIDRRIESYDMLLVKVLDICETKRIPSCISRLVLLRYLAIRRMFDKSSVLLSSISGLKNLQYLILGSCMEEVVKIPDFIWDMVKLRHIQVSPSALFHVDSKRLQNSDGLLKNLMCLSKPVLSYGDSEWLNKLPSLQKLSCIFSISGGVPELDFLRQLTSLKVICEEMKRCKLVLPLRLKKLLLSGFILYSEDISEIGKSLNNLEVLKLHDCGPWDSKTAQSWVVQEGEFPKLKVLKLKNFGFYEWIASQDSLCNLEQLWLEHCDYLNKVPQLFEDIPCINLISVSGCRSSVDYSVMEIEKIQHEDFNLELKVEICPRNQTNAM